MHITMEHNLRVDVFDLCFPEHTTLDLKSTELLKIVPRPLLIIGF